QGFAAGSRDFRVARPGLGGIPALRRGGSPRPTRSTALVGPLTGALVALTAVAASAQSGPPTVAATLAELRAKAGVTVAEQAGWTVIQDGLTMYSFTPAGHPAHPAAVRRTVFREADGAWSLKMSILCEAAQPACDKLAADFQELNNKMREDLARSRGR